MINFENVGEAKRMYLNEINILSSFREVLERRAETKWKVFVLVIGDSVKS